MTNEERLKQAGIELPDMLAPIANYCLFRREGDYLYCSGQGPALEGKAYYSGKVGRDISKEEAYRGARMAAVNVLAIMKQAVGSLDEIDHIVSMTGYVNSADDFYEQPYVINGASDVFTEVFGDDGKHARCALSCGALPMNICLEISVIAKCK